MKLRDRNHSLAPDVDLIRSLAALLTETGLGEIEYAVGDRRIRVVRHVAPPAIAGTPLAPAPAAAAESTPPTAPRAPALPAGTLTAPMVGTVYLAPQPGAPPFVRLGERVDEGQVLLIIEAMKVMNQIRAPRAGQVSHIIVDDGNPVEFGAPLMVIE